MTILERMKEMLENEPRARERSKKDNAIRIILCDQYPALREVPKEDLLEALRAYASYDRAWRMVLMEYPHLRGSDYDDGHRLAVKKMDELGYTVQPDNYVTK